MRRIDWNAYARLEELVLRLYVAEEDLTVHLLIDTSASLGFGEKLDVAKRLAAAIAYVGLSGSERVAVVPWGSGLKKPLPPTRGKARIARVLRFLDELEPSGETDLAKAVDQLLVRRARPGLVVVISDFLDPAGWQAPIDRLLANRHEPALFQVLSREELDPLDLGGDVAFVDAERGGRIEVSLDGHVMEAYRARLYAFFDELETYARRRGISYVRTDADVPFEDALFTFLRAG